MCGRELGEAGRERGRGEGRGVGRHQPGREAIGQMVETDSHLAVSHHLFTGFFFSFLFKKSVSWVSFISEVEI